MSHNKEQIKIGLTGGIGTGKTFVGAIFSKLGIPVFNADLEAKKCMVENEILLGDSIDRKKMAKMAKLDKSMSHQHSNSVLLEPKEKQDLIWKFSKAQNIEIACNVPGHYEAGMIAQVKIDQ